MVAWVTGVQTCALPIFAAEIKARLRGDIGMAPAVEDDPGNIALRVETRSGETGGQLLAELPFEIGVTRREQLRASRRPLLRTGKVGVQEGDIEGQHRRAVGREGRRAAHIDIPPDRRLPTELGRPPGRDRVCQYV